ncbi:DUF3179 domain-containing protein [Aestuariirhabdus sp. Z084]|uniref:DUF3179 domain-containing protein n=1 Tax=Aestuariirhabdus haliotis TaxID=2918751 RepID=UPI00201B3E57|nr:DUF3179 domain-containing protein [Aestuariirhabdus haliotis]MCL6415569.1 DUF3179 domain-containing protein [Aestuariirhabdus haliotis]MCL6419226.1 DUF3179 domain-containing protein [Aestuariirhabdus haliotis]
MSAYTFAPAPVRQLRLSLTSLMSSILLSVFVVVPRAESAGLFNQHNGFDLSDSSLPVNEIMHGGPPRDGIPAIDKPRFIGAEQADYLDDDARVMGVSLGGQQKAYPIGILNYHEIVNDSLAGTPIAVTYCPLCGTGIVYQAQVKDQLLQFGVSGLLYNSDVLLYDRQTESLWSQVLSRAVTGPMKDQPLELIAASHTSWKDWHNRYPDTLVLSRETGYRRDYSRSPYGDYDQSPGVYFPVANRDDRYHNKEVVLTLELNGQTRAWPFVELARYQQQSGANRLQDRIGTTAVTIDFNLDARSARVLDSDGQEIPSVQAFWFAWIAFHPGTGVYQAPVGNSPKPTE